jgi:hypothetical protein
MTERPDALDDLLAASGLPAEEQEAVQRHADSLLHAEPPVRIAVDADCPGCDYPERAFDPTTGVFSCSSLNHNQCGYTSTDRDR